mgnify:CR=1 FL=1|tara:strand:+ start:117 stop:563 length:447 start_codon:yes stop_codon:yes gene_type:complete
MANVNIKFNGKEFLLSCENGQEEHLEELSINLNNKFDDLKKKLGNIGESKLLLITSITVMDEYFETIKKVNTQKKQLEDLKLKFKELKSLVYEYKEKKEKQEDNLNKRLSTLENDIFNHKNEYENLLDKTALEIESFISKYDNNFKTE